MKKAKANPIRDLHTGRAPAPPKGLPAQGITILRPRPAPPGPGGGAQPIDGKVKRP